MFLEEKIVSTLGIAFFIICIISISYLSFFVSNSDVKKKIYTFSLICGIFFSAIETIEYRNTANFEILLSRAIGGILGCITGFYLGYQFFSLIKVIDDTSFTELTESSESSDVAIAFCYGLSIAGRELGSFLGDILFPILL